MAAARSKDEPKDDAAQLRVAIKLRAHVRKPPRALDGWQRHVAGGDALAPLGLAPLFESQDPKRLQALVDRARRVDPDYDPPDLLAWFQAEIPRGVRAQELVLALRRHDDVETAHVMRPGPPPVTPGDDPRNANQGYEDAAPNGIDARYAWGFAGGDGAGIGFVDMEQGWNLNHEDLAAAGITLISGVNNAYFFHGTSVLGEVLMVDNNKGGVGIAPAATGRVVSQQRTAASYNTADAIVDAVANMAFGDVLLLEAQEYDPVGGLYYWPVEIADANYDAIRLATALGVVVIEAGCNGGYDLDAYVNGSAARIFDRTAPGFRDSGAIMVGAASSAAPHARLGFSNHGNRIDCYAWGENVDTASTDAAGTDNTAYTTGFNGTSSATPIVAGAALIVQGIAQASLGYRFSPRELRRILTTNGTPSANPATDGIGVMPDLHAIISGSEINLAPDVYLRDYVGDTGNPTSGIVSQSPDIIVRQAAVANAQAAFGAGSGTENDVALSDAVDSAHDNLVYVRLRNRGGSAAAPVSVDVYWSPPSTLVTPNLWTPIGSVTLPSVPTGNVLTVSDALTWPKASIPGPGHYCFVAVAGSAADPKPSPAAFATFAQYVSYVSNNNNVAWRNFDVIPAPPSGGPPPGAYALDFIVAGAFDTGHRFELESIGRLPQGSRAALDMPAWLAESLRPRPGDIALDRKRDVARVALNVHGSRRLGSVLLHADVRARCTLRVQIPDKQRRDDCEFAIRQSYKGIEVGRVTFRFAALREPKQSHRPARR